MHYEASPTAITVFLIFVGFVLALSFYLGRRAKSERGYFAAHGQIGWFVNGVAFAGDYLSAASFLGICGMIAFYGYDGFLYSIGFLAGWVVALFVIAEPIKRLGRYTFADALNAKFNSRGIQIAAAISTLVVSIFYLIPQMVGAGALIKPLLGLPYWMGVLMVGTVVIIIVVTAGMVSTTWVQFIKGSMLVIFCTVLVVMILRRGLTTHPAGFAGFESGVRTIQKSDIVGTGQGASGTGYARVRGKDAGVKLWSEKLTMSDYRSEPGTLTAFVSETMTAPNVRPIGHVASLPGGLAATGPLSPLAYLSAFGSAEIVTWSSEAVKTSDGWSGTAFYQVPRRGDELLIAGGSSTFKGVRSQKLVDKLDFVSLMLALFAGTASLPHILIRYYTVKDAAAARKSTVVGIASIGFFYILTLYIGLGAMVSGNLDPTNSNMAAPLLAKSFGELPFAIISAIAFTTVLGTVSGLIMAASGAVAHDLMENVFKHHPNENAKVGAAKWTAMAVGVVAMGLGILFEKLNVGFLVGWAFNIAASANLPALVMLLFWKHTTRQGIVASIWIGLISSLGWLLLSAPAFKDVYGLDPAKAIAPFTQPGLVTIPLGFVVLVIVSLITRVPERVRGFEVVR